jgi:hypothetical protein
VNDQQQTQVFLTILRNAGFKVTAKSNRILVQLKNRAVHAPEVVCVLKQEGLESLCVVKYSSVNKGSIVNVN